MEQEIFLQNSVVDERDTIIKEICDDIQEINGMFSELSNMMKLQSSTLDCVETSIVSTIKNTNEGVSHLRKADEYHKKQSGCVIF